MKEETRHHAVRWREAQDASENPVRLSADRPLMLLRDSERKIVIHSRQREETGNRRVNDNDKHGKRTEGDLRCTKEYTGRTEMDGKPNRAREERKKSICSSAARLKTPSAEPTSR